MSTLSLKTTTSVNGDKSFHCLNQSIQLYNIQQINAKSQPQQTTKRGYPYPCIVAQPISPISNTALKANIIKKALILADIIYLFSAQCQTGPMPRPDLLTMGMGEMALPKDLPMRETDKNGCSLEQTNEPRQDGL